MALRSPVFPHVHLCNLSLVQQEAVTQELLSLGVISETTYHPNKYISCVFPTQKLDHSHPMILNLKKFNEFVCHLHFKMESLHDEVTHVGGRWTETELPHHINALELHATYLTLGFWCTSHIRLMLDNTTATTYLNKIPSTFGTGFSPQFVCKLFITVLYHQQIKLPGGHVCVLET